MAFGYEPNAKITIAVYREHCTLAGRRCADPLSRYGDDWRECDDIEVFEGTEAELRQWAAELSQPQRSLYSARCARTILAYLD
jgi:hypothetical protein